MSSDRQAGVERFVNTAFENLDRLTYYRLLNIEPGCAAGAIKTAYYKLAGRLHPDLYGRNADPEFKRRLTAVYSRLAEAYKVLSDAKRRTLYDKELAAGNLRLTADAEAAAPARQNPEDSIDNASAKKFYKLGIAALNAGDRKSAVMNLKLALSMAPSSAVIKEALARAEGT